MSWTTDERFLNEHPEFADLAETTSDLRFQAVKDHAEGLIQLEEMLGIIRQCKDVETQVDVITHECNGQKRLFGPCIHGDVSPRREPMEAT